MGYDFYHEAKQAKRNWLDAEHDLQSLRVDYDNLVDRYNVLVRGFNNNLNVISELEAQKSELEAQLLNSRNISDILTKRCAELGKQNDQINAALAEMRQKASTTSQELQRVKDISIDISVGYFLAKADGAGKQAMLDLYRKPQQGIDLDATSDEVPAPEGYRDSPLQGAYRVAYARFLKDRSIDRKTLDAHEAKNGNLPFPVADYVEWLSDPDNTYDGTGRKRKVRGFINTDANLLYAGDYRSHEDIATADDEVENTPSP